MKEISIKFLLTTAFVLIFMLCGAINSLNREVGQLKVRIEYLEKGK